jgi:hypothetical protein
MLTDTQRLILVEAARWAGPETAKAIRAALKTAKQQNALLRLVWLHMHGFDLNGIPRRLGDESARWRNWGALQEMLDAKYGDRP